MIVKQLKAALINSVTSGRNPFVTYKEFAKQYGFNADYCPSWANRSNLDAVALELTNDPAVAIDLTFCIRNKSTKYPSVINGRPFDPNDQKQKRAARVAAGQIIRYYHLKFSNPYP